MNQNENVRMGVLQPNVGLEKASCLVYISSYGVGDYIQNLSIAIPMQLLRQPNEKTVEHLEKHLERITIALCKGYVDKSQIAGCEVLLIFLVNTIGVLRAHLKMGPSKMVEQCNRAIDLFQKFGVKGGE